MRDLQRRVAAGIILALAPIGLTVVWLVVRGDVPDRLATHFGLNGVPNDFQDAGLFVAWLLPLTAVLAIAGIVIVARPRLIGGAAVAGILGYLAWLMGAVGATTLLAARGVADPHDIRSGWLDMLLVMALSVLVGVVLWRLVPAAPRPARGDGTAPSLRVAPGERVYWRGTAVARPIGWLALAFLVVSGIVLIVAGWWALVVLFVALVLGSFRSVVVHVDNEHVLARVGALPWPIARVAIGKIESASVEEIIPMRWGGWGYRLSGRGTAIVIRRGPGIVLHRTGRSDLAITVDDAETAVGLINGLIEAKKAAV